MILVENLPALSQSHMYRAGASSFSMRVVSGKTVYSIDGVSNLIYLFFSGSADNEGAIAKENRDPNQKLKYTETPNQDIA